MILVGVAGFILLLWIVGVLWSTLPVEKGTLTVPASRLLNDV